MFVVSKDQADRIATNWPSQNKLHYFQYSGLIFKNGNIQVLEGIFAPLCSPIDDQCGSYCLHILQVSLSNSKENHAEFDSTRPAPSYGLRVIEIISSGSLLEECF